MEEHPTGRLSSPTYVAQVHRGTGGPPVVVAQVNQHIAPRRQRSCVVTGARGPHDRRPHACVCPLLRRKAEELLSVPAKEARR